MAAIATGNNISPTTKRRVMLEIYNPAYYEPLLPTKERQPFLYVIRLPTLSDIISPLTLCLRVLIYIVFLVDFVLAYLLYPLLGLVILSLMFSHSGDAHPLPSLLGHAERAVARVGSTKILTTTVTRMMFPAECFTTEELDLSTECSEIPAFEDENTIKLPTFPVSDIFSVVSEELGEDVLTASSSDSEETSIATEEAVVETSSIASVASSSESVLASLETSTASLKIPSRSPTLSPSSDAPRTSTLKKRMHELIFACFSHFYFTFGVWHMNI
ncbi:hypothetical protein IFR05_011787 [Cadophora sp. M221]|nr:hypothetical protein IFR05_011787 [Cadophora sp. M221]